MIRSIVFITFFLGSLLSFSQNQFGVKAGATLGFFDNEGKEYDVYEPKLGFSIGGIGRFQISDKYFLKSEIYYSRISASIENSDIYFNLDRIGTMLLAGYQVSNKIDVELGPKINKVVRAISGDSQSVFNQTSQYSKINIGIGIGSNIKINDQFEFNARYSVGLLYYDTFQIIDENQNDIGKTERVSYLSLGVNYSFKN